MRNRVEKMYSLVQDKQKREVYSFDFFSLVTEKMRREKHYYFLKDKHVLS